MTTTMLIAMMIAAALCVFLFVPFMVSNVKGKSKGHTWFNWWKPQGHSDIGPDFGGPRLTRHGADDARGARH